ncbi:MAG: NIPSNAP family containing protein [Alphaproteobacteria bacterium]|nr:NIPSNAP family containing protein [Alphaproteobacteria bacterium]
MAFFELRQYKIRRNKMKEWLKVFDEEIAPFQIGKGMVICGSWHGEADDSIFVWMRRFNSEKERERLYKAVYEDPYWQTEIAPRVGKLIFRDKIQVQRIVPNKKSNVQ